MSDKGLSKLFKSVFIVIALSLIVFILFKPFFISGRLPIPIDIPVGMYYPWLNHSYGYPVHPPVKNHMLTDTVSQFWIWRNWAIDSLKQGWVAIWNPYSLSGYSLSPWFHTNLFSPANVFYFFLTKLQAMSWSVIIQFILSLVSSFFLGKFLTRSSFGGLFLGIAWSLSSYFVGWMTWASISLTLAFLPATILFLMRSQDRHSRLDFLFLVLSLTGLILSGHPQTAFYAISIYLTWGLINRISLVRVFLPLALSLLISSLALVPSIDIIIRSVRFEDPALTSVNYGFIPVSKLLYTLFSVNGFGSPATGNYFGGDYNFIEKLVNFGIIPLFLSVYYFVLSLIKRRFDRLTIAAIVLVVIGFALATEYPLGWLVYRFNLPLLSTGPAGRAFIFAIFGFVILATRGLVEIYRSGLNLRALFLSGTPFLWALLAIVAIPLLSIYRVSQDSFAYIYTAIVTDYWVAVRNNIYPLAVFLCFSFTLLIHYFLPRFKQVIFSVILALTFIEGFIFFGKFTPFVDPELYFPTTPALSFLIQEQHASPDFFRIERENVELLPPNMWHVFNLSSTSGYDPMAPLSYAKFLQNTGVQSTLGRYLENGHPGIDKLDNLGVKYLLALKRDKNGILGSNGSVREWIDLQKWLPVFEEGSVTVFQNKSFRPPYYFEDPAADDQVNLIKHTDTTWSFSLLSSTAKSFILMENNHPFWTAYIDNQVVPIENYLGSFKKVQVPSGAHTLNFVYHNRHLDYGVYLTVFGLLMTGFIMIFPKFIMPRTKKV